MLVLSRKTNQKVVFPNLGVTVAVIGVQGGRVKLGIDAPSDIQILRDELTNESVGKRAPNQKAIDRHAIRNRLNTVMLSLHVMQRNSVLDPQESDEALAMALRELEVLNAELGPAITSASDTSAPASNPTISDGRCALVVEDNDQERSLMSAYLKRCGFKTIEAENGQAAMNYLENNALPHVVLLDMHMPQLNGAETVTRIRRTPALRDVRVFGVSGSDFGSWTIPDGSRGVDRWFQKPVNPERIVKEINDLVCI